jgi:subtilase family serine protease
MRRRSRIGAAVATLALVAVPLGAGAVSGAGGGATAVTPSRAALGGLISIHPGAIHFGPDLSQLPPTTAQCEALYDVACYEPGQIADAYDILPLWNEGIDGRGQTIVIVDSFGSPTVEHDLAYFDRAFGLPAPPSFIIIEPAGAVAPYVPDSNREGWAGETNLDVEYAHMMAPKAAILLVETPTSENEGTSGFPQIVTAETYVVDHHLGGVISQSFSATEQTFPTAQSLLALRSAYVDAAAKGVTVLAASGDSGAADVGPDGRTYYDFPVTSWPDSDPLVTGVGGTQLHLNSQGVRTGPDTVWNDTYNVPTQEFIFGKKGAEPLAGGGGKSIIFSRPGYQDGVAAVVGPQRGVPDISMSGACNGAVDVYQSFAGQPAGWYPTCGTSEATPLFAGVVALADQAAGHPLGLINPALYALSARGAPGIVDITSGNNTVTFHQGGVDTTVNGFDAGPGYDLASGVGTVDAAKFVPELARQAS